MATDAIFVCVIYLVGPDCGDHVRGPAVDGHVVAGGELVRANHVLDDQEGLLDGSVLNKSRCPTSTVNGSPVPP